MSAGRRPDEVVIAVRRPAAAGCETQVLVLLRSPVRGGYWNLPAGGAEWGEEPSAAAARELLEETGLAAAVSPLGLELAYSLAGQPDAERARYGGVDQVRIHAFAADAPAGWEPELDEEHVAVRWCGREEALRLLPYPEPRAAVEAALA